MKIEQYPWLEPLWQKWQTQLAAERVSQAVLLIAPEGFGAEALVEQWSRAVMCTHFADEACGFCHSCQLMASGNHPDYHVIRPEQAGKAITVDQIRHCNRLAQESSQLSGYRLIVIEPADAMNEAAANALLKTLESSAERCLFLLVARQARSLLPTVISRCQQWHITPPTAEQVSTWLAERTQGSASSSSSSKNKTSKASTTTLADIPHYVAYLNDYAPLTTQAFVEQGELEQYQALETQFCATIGTAMFDPLGITQLLVVAPLVRLRWVWLLLADAQKRHFGIVEAHTTPGSAPLMQHVSYDVLYRHARTLSALMAQLHTHSGLNAELLIMNWLITFNEDACS